MQIAIGSDHRGYQLKEKLIERLKQLKHVVDDEGACDTESVDYPDIAAVVARKVSRGEAERGILICGTGIGMAIAANKFTGVRAAPINDDLSAELSRRHNDLNVLCLSGDMVGDALMERILDIWLTTEFEGGRHGRRVQKIAELETD
ncbi:MAG: ribose 5-phosphate isomerase B [Pirellulales bacterium]